MGTKPVIKARKKSAGEEARIEAARALYYGPIPASNVDATLADAEHAFARNAAMVEFLKGIAITGVTLTGCEKAAHILNPDTLLPFSRQQYSKWRNDFPVFDAAWNDAAEAAYDAMEAEAVQRGSVGSVEEEFYGKNGEIISTKKRRSDTLLMFMLNGRRSGVFRNRTELTGPNGGPLQMTLAADDARARLAAKIQAKIAGAVASAPGDGDAGPTET